MLRLNVYLCMLLLVLGIAVRFGDCQDDICKKDVEPGSEESRVSGMEGKIKYLMSMEKKIKNIIDRIHDKKDANTKPDNRISFGNILQKLKNIKLIFPGTKWCGDGDIARDENDLGLFKDTDACCRAHDLCSNDIATGETKKNLKNIGIFTRSICTCDTEFYNCLKAAKNVLSLDIGKTYFNLLKPQCFQCVCPTKDCNKTDGTECKDFCTRYEWLDNPKF